MGKDGSHYIEVLMGLPTVGAVIRENRTMLLPSLMQMGRTLGMRTADDSLMELVKRGLVEPEVAYNRASDKERFESLVGEELLSGGRA